MAEAGYPFIIAELGTAHGGSIAKAKELVDAAAGSGADCVKFQIVYADEILHPRTGEVPLPGGALPLYQIFKNLEVAPSFFAELKVYAEKKNLCFLATPFGPRAAAELKALRPAAVKIASPELNYTRLLREAAGWGVPLFLSTGVSTLADIEMALDTVCPPLPLSRITLLHCVTAYPAPPEEYNLRLLTALQAIFGVKTGVSDHSLDPLFVPAAAAALGAAAIEKHFCLSRSGGGLDDPVALPPGDFKRMVTAVRETAALRAAKGESAARALLNRRFGAETVAAITGSGVKSLAPAEKANYGRTNRSIHALRAIREGEAFSQENIAVLRTEKVLRPGLSPSYFEALLGRPARAAIPEGEGVRFEDI